MGASDILLLEDNLPLELKELVEIEGSTCLGMCREEQTGKAPFVSVNGEIMSNATLPSVLQKIREVVRAQHQ
jgi:NADH:ubiquinone oxidoreductase subunit E